MSIIKLTIDGQEADFKAFLKEAVAEALAGQAPVIAERFPDPDMAYAIKDERVIRMFAVQDNVRPTVAVISALRKAGISPVTNRRAGSIVYGHQLIQYMEARNHKDNIYSKN